MVTYLFALPLGQYPLGVLPDKRHTPAQHVPKRVALKELGCALRKPTPSTDPHDPCAPKRGTGVGLRRPEAATQKARADYGARARRRPHQESATATGTLAGMQRRRR